MSNESTVLLSSIVERASVRENGVTVTSFKLSGDPHAEALVAAVNYDYARRTGRAPTSEELLAKDGAKVTVARTGSSTFGATSIQATQGTVMNSSGRPALMLKGKRTKGIYLDGQTRVLDFELGYNQESVLKARVDQVLATFPKVDELTQDHLEALPSRGKDVTLAVFGTWRGPDGSSPGAMWLIHSYLRTDDIVEGVLIVRPEHGESEHGSLFGKQLLGMGGVVLGFDRMSLKDALALANADYDEALTTVVEATKAAV